MTDAAKARAASERAALQRGRARNVRVLEAIRLRAGGPSAKRGQVAGANAGQEAGKQEIAARGAGPTVLPLPVLASNLYDLPPSGFAERPSAIQIGNHSRLENVSWSSWSDNASGTATLVGNDCEPSCAEGSETRTSAQLSATDPSFTSESKRYYGKLTVTPADDEVFSVEINPEATYGG